jgi:hypothetical protein
MYRPRWLLGISMLFLAFIFEKQKRSRNSCDAAARAALLANSRLQHGDFPLHVAIK